MWHFDMCRRSLLLSLETSNNVQSVAQQSWNIQATSEGSDQKAYAQADLRFCWSHIPHCRKSHAAAQLFYAQAQETLMLTSILYTYMRAASDQARLR